MSDRCLQTREAGDPAFKTRLDLMNSGVKLTAAFAQDEELGVISLSVSRLSIRYQFSKSFKKTDPMLTPG